MKQRQSWKITDEFWDEVKQLIPVRQRSEEKEYKRKAGGGRTPIEPRKALSIVIFSSGVNKAFLKPSGLQVWSGMTKFKVLIGLG